MTDTRHGMATWRLRGADRQAGTMNREQRRHPVQKPPTDPGHDNNPGLSENPPKDAYAGRADQDVTQNTGPGAGGATEYGGGNKNHPSRITSGTPAGQKR